MSLNASEQMRSLVTQYIKYLAGRDIENLMSLFAEQVDWFIPGNQDLAPWLGRRSSKEEIRMFFKMLWENTEPVSAKVEHILIEGNFGIITGEFSTRMLKTGKIFDSIFSIHLTVESNLIVRYRLQEDSYAVSEALTE
ncbi:MAG TPA: nuclear transport factor 2 family protein [Sphingobacteriaceae bacterium]